MSLFKFIDKNEVNQRGAYSLELEKKGHVNVVMDYAWTVQPKSSRIDVPYIFMIERKLTNDVMIQQLLYNLSAAADLGSGTTTEFLGKLRESITDEKEQGEGEQGGKNKNEVTKTNSGDDKLQSRVNQLLSSENPYAGLYSLEDTGWSYILPFFSGENRNISGDWGEPEGSGIVGGLLKMASESISQVATDVNKLVSALGAGVGETDSVRPGTYIERAKQYKFNAQGPSYSVNFNLYNTGKIQDVIDNWELCFALMYNLLPNRRSKTVFDPPPLYEIEIPGVRRSPASFIKGMQVNFLGATRLMDLDVAGETIRTIVPDAYSVKIDIEDVLPESKNFMQSIFESKEKVSVTLNSSGETVSRTATQLSSEYNNITKITL